ncbi:unnamed protein product [Linum trigynum]|uniref:Uncharacterized protein n=1 Tax=Linum trigynum TaxID=586398 RepID=A0AAV2C8R6_9ROSI
MKAAVRETCMVRPAGQTPSQRLWLSNLDQFFAKTAHVPMLQPYSWRRPDGGGAARGFFNCRVLKESLSQALITFFPVAGRLAQAQDGTGRFEIDCNGQGVLFVEAETDVTISELGDFQPAPELMQLVPQVDFSKGISSFPLLLVQVTRFRCGGVCLGIGYHHAVSDGKGFYNLLTAWSSLARGLSVATNLLPFLDRTILCSRSPPSPTWQHPEYCESIDDEQQTPPPSPLSTSTRILNLSVDQITCLKEEANSSTNGDVNHRYTTFEVLTAHIWRCVTVARSFADRNQPVTLHVSIDGRRRFEPMLPPGYFGNCLFHAVVPASTAELASESLRRTAGRIRRAIRRSDDEYMRSAIDCLELAGASTVRIPGISGSPHLKVISWTQLPFGQDFGWGDPIFLRPASSWEGSCLILPKPKDGDDGLSFSICLEAAVMVRFKGLLTTDDSIVLSNTTATTLPQLLSRL